MEIEEKGLLFAKGNETARLEWCRIERAIAAEVGEPEGVRTIVFDLVVASDPTGFSVYRIDAEPGDQAMALASALAAQLDPKRCSGSIKSAADGLPSRWYPDIQSFEDDARGMLSD